MREANKFIIAIEEIISDEFEIIADTAEEAMKIAEEQYKEGIIVLSPGEAQFRQMAIVRPETEATEWCEF